MARTRKLKNYHFTADYMVAVIHAYTEKEARNSLAEYVKDSNLFRLDDTTEA